MNKVLAETGISRYDLGGSTTKWARIAHAVEQQQASQNDGRPLVKLSSVAFDPRNLLPVKTGCGINVARGEVNIIMSFDGLFVSEEGKPDGSPKQIRSVKQSSEANNFEHYSWDATLMNKS